MADSDMSDRSFTGLPHSDARFGKVASFPMNQEGIPAALAARRKSTADTPASQRPYQRRVRVRKENQDASYQTLCLLFV